MSCYACEHHHGWRTQTTWTKCLFYIFLLVGSKGIRHTKNQLPGHPGIGWKAIHREERAKVGNNNGHLRLCTPPRVAHTNHLDQCSYGATEAVYWSVLEYTCSVMQSMPSPVLCCLQSHSVLVAHSHGPDSLGTPGLVTDKPGRPGHRLENPGRTGQSKHSLGRPGHGPDSPSTGVQECNVVYCSVM